MHGGRQGKPDATLERFAEIRVLTYPEALRASRFEPATIPMLSNPRQSLDRELAVALLRSACRDALRNIDTPIVRGFSGDAAFYRLEGNQGERQSRSEEGYHTIIVDEFLPQQGYPKRCESIICGSWLNLQFAGEYGAAFAIFPFDSVPIGVCYGRDFLETRVAIGQVRERMARTVIEWNQLFKAMGLSDASYSAFRAGIQAIRGNGGDIDAMFPPGRDIDRTLQEAYGSSRMRLQIVNPATLNAIQDRQREMWFSGPCIAVRLDQLALVRGLLHGCD